MDKKRVIEIKTIKSIVIKNLFEVVKQYIKETNIIINKDGMKLSSIDTSKNSFTFVKLLSEQFASYKCDKEVVIGLNIVVLFKVLKTVNRREIITMYMNEDEEENFYVEIFDPSIKKRKVYKIPVLVLDNDKDINIQEMSFDYIINISTSQFQQIIKDIHTIEGKIVDIKSVGKQLIISCDDGIVDFTTTINELDDENDPKNSIKFTTDSDKIVQGKFKLNYLLDFIKASQLCENMNILLTNDKPLILEYFVADLGSLRLLLIPYTNQ